MRKAIKRTVLPARRREAQKPPTVVSPSAWSNSAAWYYPTPELTEPAPIWAFYLDSNMVAEALANTYAPRHGRAQGANVATMSPSRDRHNLQLALYDLVSKLPLLPEGHSMSVDGATVGEALKVLNYLASFEVEPPSVFTHGGDAVVFKWDKGNVARYLTVGGPEVSLLDLRKSDTMKCTGEYDLNDETQRAELLKIVGGVPSSASVLVDAT